MTTNTQRKRGRPRNDGRPPLTREAILDAAQKLFGENGFAGTSIRLIANELGVFNASIHYHFPTKESILDAIFSNWFDTEANYFRKINSIDAPPEVKLYRLIYEDVFFVASQQLGPQRMFLLPELREKNFPEAFAGWKYICNSYSSLIQQGIREGALLPVNDRTIGEHFFNLSSTVLASLTPEEFGPPEEQASIAADFGIRGILVDVTKLDEIKKDALSIPLNLND